MRGCVRTVGMLFLAPPPGPAASTPLGEQGAVGGSTETRGRGCPRMRAMLGGRGAVRSTGSCLLSGCILAAHFFRDFVGGERACRHTVRYRGDLGRPGMGAPCSEGEPGR